MNIPEISEGSQYWVVRAGRSGVDFNLFAKTGVVALGHMDHVRLDSEGRITAEHLPRIQKELNKLNQSLPVDDRLVTAQMTANYNQIRMLVEDIKVGDTIFTLTHSHILVGTVISQAYVDSKPLKVQIQKDDGFITRELNGILKRDVKWEEQRLRSTLPPPIQASLNSQRSVFSLQAHSELLTHWLYSCYIQGKKFHFTNKIGHEGDISQFHLTEFQRIIQQLELFSNNPSSVEWFLTDQNQFLDAYTDFGKSGGYTLSNKSIFTSPGSVWGSVSFEQRVPMLLFIASLTSCMGENSSFQSEEDGQVISANSEHINKVHDGVVRHTPFELHKSKLEIELAKPNKTSLKEIKAVKEDMKLATFPPELEEKVPEGFPNAKPNNETGI
ncbi:hypothetical protein SIO17_14560 [Pseudoalteromonas piscicida]|uniref:Uncharacterized protein n=1 Tax=Pseudoalteromonas piscicida TaxID=43662 RepID=A0ABM6NHG4_PSEO7|nr:hypothetical protein [Pseudoalteromonas piscicida]ATD08278.1 hypothetical protein PPIS_a3496 [Pseudoalteromonas piscicida]WPU30329.1 hypothetical protein SIO17_14560 [Pseudoalteromonas piscicida]